MEISGIHIGSLNDEDNFLFSNLKMRKFPTHYMYFDMSFDTAGFHTPSGSLCYAVSCIRAAGLISASTLYVVKIHCVNIIFEQSFLCVCKLLSPGLCGWEEVVWFKFSLFKGIIVVCCVLHIFSHPISLFTRQLFNNVIELVMSVLGIWHLLLDSPGRPVSLFKRKINGILCCTDCKTLLSQLYR